MPLPRLVRSLQASARANSDIHNQSDTRPEIDAYKWSRNTVHGSRVPLCSRMILVLFPAGVDVSHYESGFVKRRRICSEGPLFSREPNADQHQQAAQKELVVRSVGCGSVVCLHRSWVLLL